MPTKRLSQPGDGYDRDAGEGVGHLFKMDMAGNLIADLTLGEGAIYHPGGIDYDGKDIWVPVGEYRPNSRSIIYRVDPETMKPSEVFRVSDHIGGIVHNTDDHTLHGVSWGSRRFYRWTMGRNGTDHQRRRAARAVAHAQHVALRRLSGLQIRREPSHALQRRDRDCDRRRTRVPFRLGGIELVDLRDGRPLHQVPVLLWTAGGLDMTHNPVWIEPSDSGLRALLHAGRRQVDALRLRRRHPIRAAIEANAIDGRSRAVGRAAALNPIEVGSTRSLHDAISPQCRTGRPAQLRLGRKPVFAIASGLTVTSLPQRVSTIGALLLRTRTTNRVHRSSRTTRPTRSAEIAERREN